MEATNELLGVIRDQGHFVYNLTKRFESLHSLIAQHAETGEMICPRKLHKQMIKLESRYATVLPPNGVINDE